MMGQPMGGFPEKLQKLVLKGEEPITCRPGEMLPPEDFEKVRKHLKDKHDLDATEKDIISYALYPEVFDKYLDFLKEYGDLSHMGSDVFFHGLYEGETAEIELQEGKTFIVQLSEIGKVDSEGNRVVVFEINGNRREIKIKDKSSLMVQNITSNSTKMADPANKKHIGSSIPGTVIKVLVNKGDKIKEGDSLIVIEAMKMETNIVASFGGIVENLLVKEGDQVKSGQLLLELE